MSMTEHVFLAWAIKEGTGKLLTWRTLSEDGSRRSNFWDAHKAMLKGKT